jgi:hypothetical protein
MYDLLSSFAKILKFHGMFQVQAWRPSEPYAGLVLETSELSEDRLSLLMQLIFDILSKYLLLSESIKYQKEILKTYHSTIRVVLSFVPMKLLLVRGTCSFLV